MKSILILITAYLCLGTPCFGESADSSINATETEYRLGIKMGANLSWATAIKSADFKSTPIFGIVSGLYFVLPFNKNWGVQPELLFSQRGFGTTGLSAGISYDIKRRLSYVEVPLFFAYKPFTCLSILLGPQYSFCVQQDDGFKNANGLLIIENRLSINKARQQNISIVGGLDYNLNEFTFGARMGLDAQAVTPTAESVPSGYTSTWLQATVAYTFEF